MDEISLGDYSIVFQDDGWVTILDRATSVELSYDRDEWSAFVAGIKAGEFAAALDTPGGTTT